MGSVDLGYVNRRSLLNTGVGVRCDDFKDMYPNGLYPTLIGNDNVTVRGIKEEGQKNAIRMEIYYDGFWERFLIFGVNDKGFRWHFLTVEGIGETFAPLDGETLTHVKKIFFYNRNPKHFWKDFRESKKEKVRLNHQERYDQLKYFGGQYQRTIQKMSRIYGLSNGKTNMPFGRPSTNRRF